MAISKRLPKKITNEQQISVSEQKITDLIGEGGKVPQQKKESTIKRLQLRLPERLVEEIDKQKNKSYDTKFSRHSWIVQAIVKQLERAE